MGENDYKSFRKIGRYVTIYLLIAAIITLSVLPVFAWFYVGKNVAFYGPVSSPESIAIGAGHKEQSESNVDDARFLYFNELDVSSGNDYSDYLFCVFGNAVKSFRLQLAFTTNNQFDYQLFQATEYTEAQYNAALEDENNSAERNKILSEAVSYKTVSGRTYYYTVESDSDLIEGNYLNKDQIALNDVANSSLHEDTYGDYDNVHVFAEPLYWQTESALEGNQNDFFVFYLILRVGMNGKKTNDRETDILCIAAKSSYEVPGVYNKI